MPPTLLSFRFGTHNPWSPDSPQTPPPTQSISTDKGKAPARDDRPIWSSHGYGVMDRDPFASSRPLDSSRSSNDSPSRPSTSSSSPNTSKKPQRTSILMAASDALAFKFRRRKPSTRQPPPSVILDDVIEITARKRDEEEEERNRLRAEAAQAIGLDPFLVDQDVQSHHNTTDEEEEEDLRQRQLNSVQSLVESQNYAHNTRSSTYAPHIPTGQQDSSTSDLASGPPPPMPVGRYRPGSLAGGHSRTNSANLTPIPAYPSTVSSLTQWQQHAGTMPKYYPPSSLRIFALSNSRNWKARYIMLTSPTAIMTRTRAPAVSYLHLFKASGPDEKELERLAINEDSVVFVSDDGVGGRRHVIKVGGMEAGAFKKELNVEESGRTMWFLQIPDPVESQQWISGIKNSILNQRAVRAGLLPAVTPSFGVNEPRGDIDVMLSMRAQGFFTSPINSNARHSTPPSAVAQAEKNYASSISERSVRSQASLPKGPITVSTIKGLFSASRPRSGSRATSIDTTKPHQQQHDQNEEKDTFSSKGNNLMSMLRSATPDLQSQSSGTTVVRTNSPFVPSATPEIGIDRKIVPDHQPLQYVANGPPLPSSSSSTTSRGAKALSLGSMSLQPPPRKRWTSSVVSPIVRSTSNQLTLDVYQNADYNGTTGSLGALTYYKDGREPGSPTYTTASMTGTSESHQLRPPSMQSVSTYASNENSLSVDRSSTSTKRTSSSMRRWSRQGSLPPRTSPPSGPPPNPPGSGSRAAPIVGEANRPASRASSAKSGQSQQSIVSSLPSFSKRTSVSSVGTTSSNSHSANGHAIGRHRASMPPPPRPAPTSALPPAPGERDNSRPRSVDSMPKPTSSPTKGKRNSNAGRGFRLSMIAPSKPPPSSNLPPRPDELVEYKPPSARRSSAGNSRLSRLNPIPASPDPGIAPFPPPQGPLPPTPAEGNSNSDPNTNRTSTGTSRHTSLKQRLRILSAPSSTSSANATSTNNAANAHASSDSNNNNSPSAMSNVSSSNATTATNTHSHSNAPRLSGSGFHHNRALSTGNATPSHSHSEHNGNNFNTNSRRSAPPPLAYTPSYLSMTNTHSQPATPIGEKILSFQEESSFLNIATPISPSVPLPSPSSQHMSMSMSMSMSMPVRPLPAIPVTREVTPLSPPPRRNSKQIVVAESRPSPPRTPSTPSISGENSKSDESRNEDKVSSPPPLIPTDTFGPSTTPPSSAPSRQLPLLLSLPPSPSLQPMSEERSATPPDSPNQETYRMSPSSPASVTSFGTMSL